MPRFVGKGLGGRSGSVDAQALANALWVCYFLVVDGKRYVHLLSSGDTDAPPPTSLLIIFSFALLASGSGRFGGVIPALNQAGVPENVPLFSFSLFGRWNGKMGRHNVPMS